MASEFNKGKAAAFHAELFGEHTHSEWIVILVKIVGFLLVRYIDGE